MTVERLESSGVGSFDELCTQATEFFSKSADPFEKFWMIVPRPVHSRALAQRLSTELGICAGIEFSSVNRFIHQLRSSAGIDDDFWQTPKLAGKLHTLLALNLGEEWFRPVQHYLYPGESRPGRNYATAIRIAKLFKRYQTVHPALLMEWAAENLVDSSGNPLGERELWQAKLFQQLLSQYPTALQQDELLIGKLPFGGKRIGVFTLTGLDAAQTRIFSALAAHNDVCWWQLQQVHPESSSPLREAYGAAELTSTEHLPATCLNPLAQPDSLLGMVQQELVSVGRPTTPRIADGSIQIHASHGPDRQVEVLREVLCTLFEDDPTLEPRDVVILCQDLSTYTPLLQADFCLPPEDNHPGNQLRLRVTSQQQASTNLVLSLLDQLLQIIEGRAEVTELLAILSNPVVMPRFGLDDGLLSELTDLLSETNTNWGVDRTTRDRFDVPVPQQGTWLHGINRLLAGVAFSDQAPASLGNVLPFGLISAGDLDLLGALAEFISRVRKTALDFSHPASMSGWRKRFTTAIELFTEVDQANDWQLDNAIAALDSLGEDESILLSLAEYRVAFNQLLSPPPPRPYFLTGSLDVGRIDEFTGLPYRVVCLLGLDESFPPSEPFDGDELTNGIENAPRDQQRVLARQELLTAVLSTKEKFVVITKGADPVTNKQLDAPITILDLLTACDVAGPAGKWRDSAATIPSIVTHHPLQPFARENFTGDAGIPISFDQDAADGANAVPKSEPPSPAWLTSFQAAPESTVQLAELVKFFTDPAAALVATVGLPKAEYRVELASELPVEVDQLQRWKIGDQLVRSMLAGKTAEQSRDELLLTGLLPAGKSGERYLPHPTDDPKGLVAQAEAIARKIESISQSSAPHTRSVQLKLGEYTLIGDLKLHGNLLVQSGFGGIRAKHLLESWLSLLSAAAMGNDGVSAAILKSRSRYLAPPTPGQAQEILHGLLQLRESGLHQPLPFPAQLSLDITQTAMGRPFLGWQRKEGSLSFTPVDSAREKWGYLLDQSPAWTRFFSDVDELLIPPSLTSDPGYQLGVPRLVAVADWLWKPLGKHVVKESGR